MNGRQFGTPLGMHNETTSTTRRYAKTHPGNQDPDTAELRYAKRKKEQTASSSSAAGQFGSECVLSPPRQFNVRAHVDPWEKHKHCMDLRRKHSTGSAKRGGDKRERQGGGKIFMGRGKKRDGKREGTYEDEDTFFRALEHF